MGKKLQKKLQNTKNTSWNVPGGQKKKKKKNPFKKNEQTK